MKVELVPLTQRNTLTEGGAGSMLKGPKDSHTELYVVFMFMLTTVITPSWDGSGKST